MTNEEIIRYACTLFNDKLGQALPDALGSVIAFCINIKDQQFKEYLEKKETEISNTKAKLDKVNVDYMLCTLKSLFLDEIINELFNNE